MFCSGFAYSLTENPMFFCGLRQGWRDIKIEREEDTERRERARERERENEKEARRNPALWITCTPCVNRLWHHKDLLCQSSSLRNSPALVLKFAGPRTIRRTKIKNSPQIRSAGPRAQKIHADISSFCGIFRVSSEQAKEVSHRYRKQKHIFASLAIWGCASQIASHIAVASRDSGD